MKSTHTSEIRLDVKLNHTHHDYCSRLL